MSTYLGEVAYGAWRRRKASALKHPKLSCGCPNDGRDVYFHADCDRLACHAHREDEHDCDGPKGARAGVEPAMVLVDEAAGWLEANTGIRLEPWQRTVLSQAMQAEPLTVRLDNSTATFEPSPPVVMQVPEHARSHSFVERAWASMWRRSR